MTMQQLVHVRAEGAQIPTDYQTVMKKMSFSDEDFDGPAHDATDTKMKQYWAKKARRRSSFYKEEVKDRLGLKENAKLSLHMTKHGERGLLFSDSVIKVNRKGRTQERLLVITDGALYNIEPASLKVRRRIQLANISHISTSLLSDNFFIVHVPSEYDYLFVSTRKTEIISTLRRVYSDGTGDELQLVMQNIIDYRIDKDQQRRLVFMQGDGGVYTKLYAKRTR